MLKQAHFPLEGKPGTSLASIRPLLLRRTSIRRNLFANLISKVLSGLASLSCIPVFLRVLGTGGYGLIGVWTMLEVIANLLDLGLSPTMIREMAASSGRPGGSHLVR